MNGLDHPNILPCDSVVSTETCCYTAMPFVDGICVQFSTPCERAA